MRRISEFPSAILEWLPAKKRGRAYELRAEGEVFGTLRWPRWFSARAEPESADGRWDFASKGFWNRRTVACAPASEVELAVFVHQWVGCGNLQLADGRRFRWASQGFWRPKWFFEDEAGRVPVRLSRISFLGNRTRVEIDLATCSHPEISLLVLLGGYLMDMKTRDGAAAGAVTGAAAAAASAH